jgi:hypothetical protein
LQHPEKRLRPLWCKIGGIPWAFWNRLPFRVFAISSLADNSKVFDRYQQVFPQICYNGTKAA